MKVPLRRLFLGLVLMLISILAACPGEDRPLPTGLSSPTHATETPTLASTAAAPTPLPAATESPTSTPSRTPEPVATLAPTPVPVVSPTAIPTPVPVPTATVAGPTIDFLSTVALSGPVSSSAIAVSPDGATVATVNPDSDSITLVDAMTLAVIEEVPVGDDPRTLAFTPDSRFLLVTNRGSANVTVLDVADPRRFTQILVGPMPYGVVTDGQRAFVAEFALGNVSVIDLANNVVVNRLAVGPFPAGLAIVPKGRDVEDQGGILLITHFFNGQVTVVDLETLSVEAQASTGLGTNLSQFLVVDPSGAKAYLPQTRANPTNTAMTFDTTVFPVVNVLDLTNFSLLVRDRITIDTADRPVSIPFAAAFSPGGNRLFVVHAGSENVSVIDLANNQGLANIDVGANPRGIAITPDGSKLFVNNTLDGTMSVIDTRTLEVTDTIGLTVIPLDAEILQGKRIFNSAAAPVLTNDNWIACASCHFDGGMDGQTWEGFPDGPRNTPALFGVGETLPIHWSGDLDELQDVELTIRNIQFGTGLVPGEAHDSLGPPHAGLSADLDALAAYMDSIEVPLSPYGNNRETVKSGEQKFNTLGCQSCHAPPLFTDRQLHEVGTGDPSKEKNSHGRGTNFDTPSLRALWLTAPYFHDGRASTLQDVFDSGTVHNISAGLTPKEIEDLIAYLRGL